MLIETAICSLFAVCCGSVLTGAELLSARTSYTYPPAAFTEAHRGCFNHGSSFHCTDGADCVGQFYPDLTTCLDNWQAWWVATQGGSQPEMPSPVWVLQPGSDKFPCLNLDIASVVSGPRRCGGFV